MQRTALHTAAAKGKPAVVHLLLEAGADAEVRDASAWGSTALHLAAEHGHAQYVFCSARHDPSSSPHQSHNVASEMQ
jgi:ankyrin repeat protein